MNIDFDKFINQNKSEIFDKLAVEIANKVNHKQMEKCRINSQITTSFRFFISFCM